MATRINRTMATRITSERLIYLTLLKQMRPVLDAYRTSGPAGAITQIGFIDPKPMQAALLAIDAFIVPQAAEELYRETQRLAGLKFFRRLSKAWLDLVSKYLTAFDLTKLVEDINDTTRDWIYKKINENNAAGLGYEDLAKELEGEFTRVRAKRIARTESQRARNAAFMAVYDAVPYEATKIWSSAKDNRVRGSKPKQNSDHKGLNNKEIEAFELFVDPRNGDTMLMPGDISNGATAKSVINCRCRITWRPKRNAEGRLVMKGSG